jgi:3',5'-cyclic-AMP phosphodiesterase
MRETFEAGTPHRRGVLKCMLTGAAGGILWMVSGGVPRAIQLGGGQALAAEPSPGDFAFVQISDTHIGFHGDANPHPVGTLRIALDFIANAPVKPAMMLHTGDVSHMSKPEEFHLAEQLLKTAGLETHFIPGEHDVIVENGEPFFERFGEERKTGGWYSFDQGGVHFVALVNVLNLKPGGLGQIGADQLAWLKRDLQGKSASTPIVVLAHMPLWLVSAEMGWGTEDAAEAISYLKPFGSVTVLNGHIHQVVQKTEGSITFQTAMSTAFPQAAPGPGVHPGALKVPAEQLKSMLGVREVVFAQDKPGAAITDLTLAG